MRISHQTVDVISVKQVPNELRGQVTVVLVINIVAVSGRLFRGLDGILLNTKY
jgi:hypothetical protein